MKYIKVEVYHLEFKFILHPNISKFKYHSLSQNDTVGDLEAIMKEEFKVEKDAECRVWHRFMTNTYELLSNNSQTLQDAVLFNKTVKLCIELES